MCHSQKFGFTGKRVRDFCGVGNGFVPLKFDALEMLFLRLNEQNRFRAYFTRLKLRVFWDLRLTSVSLAITPRFC